MAITLAFALLLSTTGVLRAHNPPLWEIVRLLKTRPMVDLTHSFAPGVPHWKGFPDETRTPLFSYEKDGFQAEQFCHVGQWGTHVDPPAHFVSGLRTVDQIGVEEMIAPLVVIDVHEKVAKDPDYAVTVRDIKEWENQRGPIPAGAFVALRTDWSKRWPDQAAMQNVGPDGIAHYPGWSVEALEYLYEVRDILASGHETTDTDPGISVSKGNYEAERFIALKDCYQIELLTNLDQVPGWGAIAVIAFPKPQNGSGFPARVFAILP